MGMANSRRWRWWRRKYPWTGISRRLLVVLE
jgi:hypothetical protein